MPDLFDDLDDFTAAADQAVETDTLEERRAVLEGLKAAGGLRGDLASELLVAMDERSARAERDRQVAALEAAAESGDLDLSDPATQDLLRAQVLEKRELDDQNFKRLYAQAQVARGFPEADARKVADEAAATDVSWFYQSDPILESPAYREYAQSRSLEAKSRAFAQSRSLDADHGLAEAEAAVAKAFAEAAKS